MAETALNFLLNQLSTLLSQEATLLGELRPNVQFIKDELGSMRAFLRDVEAKEHTILELQEWVKQVREVAYDGEDVLDDFSFHFSRQRAGGFCGWMLKVYSSIKNLRTRHQISSEIKNIKVRVEDISARHQRYQSIYGVPERASTSSITRNMDYDVRVHSLLIEEAKLVGIDKPKGKLIYQVLDDNSCLKVISVLGMGGLGKSTLVKKVYDDAAVKKQFQSHAWLTISQTFQFIASLKDLIQQLFRETKEPVPPEVMASTEVEWLSVFVKKFLQNKRYILVLDDVWNRDSWDALKYALPDCDSGSRVIVTTRIADVASASCLESHGHVHKMETLSEKESWTLFCNRIFGGSHCPPHLEDVSRKILKKCGGLPLAIVAICGVLALKDKEKIDEWDMILPSLGGELEDNLDQIRKILLLSYNDLPHHLKSCLLYLCIFPEDYEIDLDELIFRWIALRFVEDKNGISAIDIGKSYAKQLVDRSLIQSERISTEGTLESVRVHDFLREIIAQKSREQNFAALVTGHYPRSFEKVRLLGICDFVDNAESQEQNDYLKCVRSLEFFGYKSPLSALVLSKFLRRCSKKLKILHLSKAALEDIAGENFKLFHLKYLSLEDTGVQAIPKSIGKLQNLEYLDLLNTQVTELPVEILLLRKLRSIECVQVTGKYPENKSVQGIKFPSRIGKLLSLEILSVIQADDKEIVREIGKLTKLRYLAITKLKREDGKEFLSSLEKLPNIKKLYVGSINEDELIDLQHSVSLTPFIEDIRLMGHLGSVSKWVISLCSLTRLTLKNSGLKEDDVAGGIDTLGDLPNLVYLVLNHAYEGETLSFKTGGFQKLKELELQELERLKWVKLEKNSMPCLQDLQILGCQLVEELPFRIENLTNLNYLRLLDMPLAEKVKNLGEESEEYEKIAHIPNIQIGNWINGEWNSIFLW